jgi:hypothetical protein
MNTNIYIATEGVHDVAFLGRLLKVCFGFERVRFKDELAPDWQVWINTFTWPYVEGRTDGRTPVDRGAVPIPLFWKRGDVYVAIVNATGVTNLAPIIERDLEAFDIRRVALEAVGIVLDADDEKPLPQFDSMASELRRLGLPTPSKLGCWEGSPRTGVFVLPNNHAQGTLEDLLLACGCTVYPKLLDRACAFVDEVQGDPNLTPPSKGLPCEPNAKEREEFKKPRGKPKAIIAAANAILKPGRPTQATLEDHRWVSEDTRGLDELQPIIHFLQQIIPPPSPAQP